jgi:hypothetical protein
MIANLFESQNTVRRKKKKVPETCFDGDRTMELMSKQEGSFISHLFNRPVFRWRNFVA